MPILRGTIGEPEHAGVLYKCIRSSTEANLFTISEDESACDVVMKQLENYDVLPEGTEVMGIYVMNGTATLNLSPQFLSGDIKADDRVVIYSIVNSLTSLPNVKNVLFNVNGKLIEKYHNSIDISKQLEFSD
jgi:hypothetical protein